MSFLRPVFKTTLVPLFENALRTSKQTASELNRQVDTALLATISFPFVTYGFYKMVDVISTPNIDTDPSKIFQVQSLSTSTGVISKPTSEQEQFQVAVDKLLNKNQ